VSRSRRDWGGRIVGIDSKRLRQGISLLACGVVFGGVTGRATAQGPPGPEPSPSPARASIRPDPAPAARGSTVSSTIVTAPVTSTPAYRPSLPAAPARSVSTARHDPTGVQATKRRTRTTPSAQKDTTRALRSLASWAPGRKLFATSAAATASSGTNFLLLFVGLGLVLLAIGETTFLRLAARAPEGRRPTEERLPIRRVQLRR
jgi:hypothetical protein